MTEYFPQVEKVGFDPRGREDLAFHVYQPERLVAGRRMEDWLRVAVCYWHTFGHEGADVFGRPTFVRSWSQATSPLEVAEHKLEAAFEFLEKLGAPYFCFHDRDLVADAPDLRESDLWFRRTAEKAAAHMERTQVRLLWGTANLFSHPRYAAGAATSPRAEVFACACAQVRSALEVTHELGGANYVLWGGREGYDTLLHTDLRRELDQWGRFLSLVVEHKHKIGFRGTLLVEPKPREPTAHQYDSDVAAVLATLQRFGLEKEVKVNVEANHATLAGHSFPHEVAFALAHDLLGSIDLNRGDPTCGWDTDQFPADLSELTLVLHDIVQAGGLGNGGFNFDARLRRQSIDPTDLFHAHVGGMDLLARALLAAEHLLESQVLERARGVRYASWGGEVGAKVADPTSSLASLADLALSEGGRVLPESGRQELLESKVRRSIEGSFR